MKAAIYPGQGKPIIIEELPDPEPGPTDVVIKVHRCGICGTDLSMTKGEIWDFGAGSQFGHEYAGEIVEVGKDVFGFAKGDRIAVFPSQGCGTCAGCRGGNPVMCSNNTGAMVGFAEYAKVPADLAIRLPQSLSMADGALIEPLAVGFYGVRQSQLQVGDTVLVLGGGAVALYAIYWARRLGARRILAMSRSARRKDLVMAMGADAFVQFGENEVSEVVEALGGAPDIVYECIGSEGMISKAILHAKIYGKIVSLGFCTHAEPIMPAVAAMKCINIQFLAGYTQDDFRFIADHANEGHADAKQTITSNISLIELPSMIDILRTPNFETKVHVNNIL